MNDTLSQTTPVLTERQAFVYDLALESLTARDTGMKLHAMRGCVHCTEFVPCDYAEKDGRDVLEALRRKGLLKRDRHHVYRRVDSEVKTSQSDGFPPGY